MILLISTFIVGCAQQNQKNHDNNLTTITRNQTIPENPSPVTIEITHSPVRTGPYGSSPGSSEKTGITFFDVHDHLFPHQLEASQIIESMDKYGITTMVNMQEPCDSYSNADLSKSGIPALSEQYPDRFISLYAGEAVNMLINRAGSGQYLPDDEERYVNLLEDAMKSGKYRGFGEIPLRHGTVTMNTLQGNTLCANVMVPGDHPWMFIMSDIAAKYNVPIDIHMEKPEAMLPGFERLLDQNPNTTIIWDHTGWNVEERSSPETWRQLLKKHPNLYGSIKCRPFFAGDAVPLTFEDKTVNEQWLALFIEFPDRFMIGTDIKPGQRAGEWDYVPPHIRVLKSLPKDARDKIARQNALRIYGKQKGNIVNKSIKTQDFAN